MPIRAPPPRATLTAPLLGGASGGGPAKLPVASAAEPPTYLDSRRVTYRDALGASAAGRADPALAATAVDADMALLDADLAAAETYFARAEQRQRAAVAAAAGAADAAATTQEAEVAAASDASPARATRAAADAAALKFSPARTWAVAPPDRLSRQPRQRSMSPPWCLTTAPPVRPWPRRK